MREGNTLHKPMKSTHSPTSKKYRWRAIFITADVYQEGLEYLSTPCVYGPSPIESSAYLAFIHAASGNTDAAYELAQSLQRSATLTPLLISAVAELYALCGDAAGTQALIDEYELFDPSTPLSNVRRACVASALNDSASVLCYLRRALQEHEAELVWIVTDPRFDKLASHGPIQELLNVVSGNAGTSHRLSSQKVLSLASNSLRSQMH